jgi:hypothetical protein
VSAQIVPFPRPDGEEVELAWATHRAFCRAEAADPRLCHDSAHNKAKERAESEFMRLYNEWCG